MSHLHNKFIVYACPVGELNKQIERYLYQSSELYGANSAHKYMPHCTLTGFFNTELYSIPIYIEALDKAYTDAKNNLDLDIKIKQFPFQYDDDRLLLIFVSLLLLDNNFDRLLVFQRLANDAREMSSMILN